MSKLADDDVAFDGAPKKGREGIPGLGLNQFSRRYIFHMLARITAFTEHQSRKADQFDKFVDRPMKTPSTSCTSGRTIRRATPSTSAAWPSSMPRVIMLLDCCCCPPTSTAAFRTRPTRKRRRSTAPEPLRREPD